MKFKTPYYVIHEDELNDNFKKLREALEKHWGNYIIGYSYKTNALPWIIKHFNSLGCYAETVSEDEYNLAKYIGVAKNQIIYNGPIKTKKSFLEALEMNHRADVLDVLKSGVIDDDVCKKIEETADLMSKQYL